MITDDKYAKIQILISPRWTVEKRLLGDIFTSH